MPESSEHEEIKKTLKDFFRHRYGASMNEYYDCGFEIDVSSVAYPSIKIMAEVIWTPGNFHRDLSLMQANNASIKVVVVNPKIPEKNEHVRFFEKVLESERMRGHWIIGMIQWDFSKKDLILGNLGSDLEKCLEEIREYKNETQKIQEGEFKEEVSPTLDVEGLNTSNIEKYIGVLNLSYKLETIVPLTGQTRVYEQNSPTKSLPIGIANRLPKEWFLPNQRTTFFNDPIFTELWRTIALTERELFENQIVNDRKELLLKENFSIETIEDAIREIEKNGFSPNLIFPTISDWIEMNQWLGESHVDYRNIDSKPGLNSSLIINRKKLDIVGPLGKVPKETILFSSKAVTWHVRRYPRYGALFIAMGNDRLYPEFYVEVIAKTTVHCEINPKGIAVLGNPSSLK